MGQLIPERIRRSVSKSRIPRDIDRPRTKRFLCASRTSRFFFSKLQDAVILSICFWALSCAFFTSAVLHSFGKLLYATEIDSFAASATVSLTGVVLHPATTKHARITNIRFIYIAPLISSLCTDRLRMLPIVLSPFPQTSHPPSSSSTASMHDTPNLCAGQPNRMA